MEESAKTVRIARCCVKGCEETERLIQRFVKDFKARSKSTRISSKTNLRRFCKTHDEQRGDSNLVLDS